MKKKVFVLIGCALLLATGMVSAMTLDEVIAGNLEAKGGEDAWKAVQTVRMKGTMRMAGGAAGALELPFNIEFKRPGKVRLEFTMQGMTAIQAFDGETGWTVMPFMGKPDPETMADDQLKQLKDQAEFDGPFVDYKAKGNQIELLGTEEVDGTPAFKLKVTKPNGDVDTVYLDEEYLVEFRQESKREIQGNQVEVATVVGDYKEVDGLMFAHSMEMAFGGGEAQQVITINSIEVGVDIPDERFAMPEKKEAAESSAE
jgi:outer membrane lipoprotein-sorting protein